jgi:outer membrane protein TolC
VHYQAALSELQAQLGAAQQRCQQLEQQLASLVDSHAQELEQVSGDERFISVCREWVESAPPPWLPPLSWKM